MIDHPMTTLELTDLHRQGLQARAAHERRARAAQPATTRNAGAPGFVVLAARLAHRLWGWRPVARRFPAPSRGAAEAAGTPWQSLAG